MLDSQQVRPPYEVHGVDVMQGANQAPEDDRLRFGELALGELRQLLQKQLVGPGLVMR
jgi:hypothetical protein